MLIGLSGQLNSLGVVKAFADSVGGVLASLHLGWLPLFALLHLVFYVLHYLFASQTAHVGALYAAFCAMMLAAGACVCVQARAGSALGELRASPGVALAQIRGAAQWARAYAGVPPVLAAMTLAYSVNLFGSITCVQGLPCGILRWMPMWLVLRGARVVPPPLPQALCVGPGGSLLRLGLHVTPRGEACVRLGVAAWAALNCHRRRRVQGLHPPLCPPGRQRRCSRLA